MMAVTKIETLQPLSAFESVGKALGFYLRVLSLYVMTQTAPVNHSSLF